MLQSTSWGAPLEWTGVETSGSSLPETIWLMRTPWRRSRGSPTTSGWSTLAWCRLWQTTGVWNRFFSWLNIFFHIYFPPRIHNLFDWPQVASFYIKCTAFQTSRHQCCANHAALVGTLHVKSKKQMKPGQLLKNYIYFEKNVYALFKLSQYI